MVGRRNDVQTRLAEIPLHGACTLFGCIAGQKGRGWFLDSTQQHQQHTAGPACVRLRHACTPWLKLLLAWKRRDRSPWRKRDSAAHDTMPASGRRKSQHTSAAAEMRAIKAIAHPMIDLPMVCIRAVDCRVSFAECCMRLRGCYAAAHPATAGRSGRSRAATGSPLHENNLRCVCRCSGSWAPQESVSHLHLQSPCLHGRLLIDRSKQLSSGRNDTLLISRNKESEPRKLWNVNVNWMRVRFTILSDRMAMGPAPPTYPRDPGHRRSRVVRCACLRSVGPFIPAPRQFHSVHRGSATSAHLRLLCSAAHML